MKSMHFALIALLVAPVAVIAAEAGTSNADARREAAITDTMAWVTGIVQGLSTLAPPPELVRQEAPASRPSKSSPARARPQASAVQQEAVAPVETGQETRTYEYSQSGRYTEVSIKISDRIENGKSKSFKLTVSSTQPLSAWTVRSHGSETPLAQGGLFGETSFSKLISHPYKPNYVMNLSVKRDGSDWVDFFKLYNENTLQSR